MEQQELITQEELAKRLDTTVQSIIIWRRRGLPFIRPPGGRLVRFNYADVLKWMTTEQTSENEARKLD